MQANLVNFIQVLRANDIRVSPAETLDAMDVAAKLGYADRTLLRDGLSMTLAKTPEEELIFLKCFDRFFQQDLADFTTAPEAEQAQSQQDASAESIEDENAQPDTDNSDGTAGDEQAGASDAAQDALEAAAQDSQALQALLDSQLMQGAGMM